MTTTNHTSPSSAQSELRRFIYTASIESTAGHQSFYIDAATREEADARAAKHDTDDIYAEEIEVQDLGKLVFEDETTTDDFGQFPTRAEASAQPIGEDAANGETCTYPRCACAQACASRANGAIGERKAFEEWAKSKGLKFTCHAAHDYYSPHEVQCYYEVWQARAALTAEKVAAQVVDSAIVDCDIDMARAVRAATHEVSLDPYMGAPQPAQTQVALTDIVQQIAALRRYGLEHHVSGKGRSSTTLNVPKTLLDQIDALLAAQPAIGGKS